MNTYKIQKYQSKYTNSNDPNKKKLYLNKIILYGGNPNTPQNKIIFIKKIVTSSLPNQNSNDIVGFIGQLNKMYNTNLSWRETIKNYFDDVWKKWDPNQLAESNAINEPFFNLVKDKQWTYTPLMKYIINPLSSENTLKVYRNSCLYKCIPIMHMFLKYKKTSPNIRLTRDMRALTFALNENDQNMIQLLLHYNAKASYDELIILVNKFKDREFAKKTLQVLFLKKLANPNQQPFIATVFLSAIPKTIMDEVLLQSDIGILKIFVAYGGDYGKNNGSFMKVIIKKNYHFLSFFLEQGVNPTHGLVYLMKNSNIIINSEIEIVFNKLIGANANINFIDENGNTLLHLLIENLNQLPGQQKNYIPIIDFFLSKQLNPNITNNKNETIFDIITRKLAYQRLTFTIDYTPLEIAKFLVDKVNDPKVDTQNFIKIFHRYINSSHQTNLSLYYTNTITFLIKYIEDPNITIGYYNDNNTILYVLCQRNGEKIVNTMITAHKTKLNLNQQNSSGDTPLHIACSKGNFNIVKLLVENGANVTIQNNTKDTPLHYATLHKYNRIRDFLVANGADMKAKNNNGITPAYYDK
jgi:ankyrin repeat protein